MADPLAPPVSCAAHQSGSDRCQARTRAGESGGADIADSYSESERRAGWRSGAGSETQQTVMSPAGRMGTGDCSLLLLLLLLAVTAPGSNAVSSSVAQLHSSALRQYQDRWAASLLPPTPGQSKPHLFISCYLCWKVHCKHFPQNVSW